MASQFVAEQAAPPVETQVPASPVLAPAWQVWPAPQSLVHVLVPGWILRQKRGSQKIPPPPPPPPLGTQTVPLQTHPDPHDAPMLEHDPPQTLPVLTHWLDALQAHPGVFPQVGNEPEHVPPQVPPMHVPFTHWPDGQPIWSPVQHCEVSMHRLPQSFCPDPHCEFTHSPLPSQTPFFAGGRPPPRATCWLRTSVHSVSLPAYVVMHFPLSHLYAAQSVSGPQLEQVLQWLASQHLPSEQRQPLQQASLLAADSSFSRQQMPAFSGPVHGAFGLVHRDPLQQEWQALHAPPGAAQTSSGTHLPPLSCWPVEHWQVAESPDPTCTKPAAVLHWHVALPHT